MGTELPGPAPRVASSPRRRSVIAWGALVALLASLAACTSEGPNESASPSDPSALGGDVLVFAAASLTDAMASLAAAFEAEHPDVDVVVSAAGSSSLREQILDGAPADVYASADPENMALLVEAGAVRDVRDLATNALVIAVPAGNPAGVRTLADFADPSRILGLCAPEVPCGRYARSVLDAAGVVPSLDTEEPDVRALLLKVRLGELDAGIVYRTDVLGVDDVEAIEIDGPGERPVPTYPIAVTTRAGRAAEAFVDFATGPEGRAILAGLGFGLPSDPGA